MTPAMILKSIRNAKKPYYVYVLARPTGEPFYIGKGAKKDGRRQRIFAHQYQALDESVRTRKAYIIRKIWSQGKNIDYRIDSWHDSESAAHQREIELIKKWGRSSDKTGILANLTAGGDGVSGLRFSKEALARMSESAKKFRANKPEKWAQRERARLAYCYDAASRKAFAQRIAQWRERSPGEHAESEKRRLNRVGSAASRQKRSKATREWISAHPREEAARRKKMAKALRKPKHRAILSQRAKARYQKRPGLRRQVAEGFARWRKEKPEAFKAARAKVNEKLRRAEQRKRQGTAMRDWHQANPDDSRRVVQSLQRWYEEHPEEVARLRRKLTEIRRTSGWQSAQSKRTKRYYETHPEAREKFRERMAKWRARKPDAARRSVAAMLTPEARAKNLATRIKYYQWRSQLRSRCEELIRRYHLDVAMPSGRDGKQVWEEFERRLHAMISSAEQPVEKVVNEE